MGEMKKDSNDGSALPRYYVTFSDAHTQVQIQAGTNEIDKFTKTDLMKMVKAFKEEVAKEEQVLEDRKKEAERELNESDERSDSQKTKRVRRTRKVRKPKI